VLRALSDRLGDSEAARLTLKNRASYRARGRDRRIRLVPASKPTGATSCWLSGVYPFDQSKL
jgi:hypothetical protein